MFLLPSVLSQTYVFPSQRAQIETSVAINPTNPKNIIATAITQSTSSDNRIGIYYSLDQGLSWNGTDDVTGPGSGDPVIDFDPDGGAYLLYQKRNDGKLYIKKSNDGGLNWTAPIMVANLGQNNFDKPWLAISPIRNENGKFNIYVSVTSFLTVNNATTTDPIPSDIVVYRSKDGASTFQSPYKELHSSYYLQGSSVAIGPNGEVYLAWADLGTIVPETKRIHIKRSTDEANSFSEEHIV